MLGITIITYKIGNNSILNDALNNIVIASVAIHINAALEHPVGSFFIKAKVLLSYNFRIVYF